MRTVEGIRRLLIIKPVELLYGWFYGRIFSDKLLLVFLFSSE